VPDTESKIAVAANKQNIDFGGLRFIISPYDEFALEAALALKEKHGGETFVFSVGGPEVTEVLRDSLAYGIDNAIHLLDPAFENLDPLSVSKVLAAAIKDGGFDLVLCGQQGFGGDNSQVPSILAELLDMPQAMMVVKLGVEGSKFRAEREIEGAHEIVEGTLPAVISAQKGLPDLRNKTIKGVMAARKKEIEVKGANALGLAGQIGGAAQKMRIREMSPPPARPEGRFLDGDVDHQVKELVRLLRQEAKII